MDLLDIKEFLRDVIKYIFVIILVLFVVIYIFTFQQIVGSSMSPTLQEDDIVILNKFIYRFKDIKRGDIVSFKYDDSKYLVKRVIGLPGETIKITNNKIYIGDLILKESYINDVEIEDFDLTSLGYDKIPDDYYFVMGDNRSNSKDSREIGLIPKKSIIGKVSIRVWPFNRLGRL